MSKLACIVNDCKGKDSGDIRLFKFPTQNLEILEMWVENLRIPHDKILPASKICSRHFDAFCIGKKYLFKGAIPTLNLGYSDNDIHLPSIHTSKRYKICSAEGCTSQSGEYVLHQVSKDPIARRAWLKICPVKKHMKDFKHLFMCNKHFDVEKKRFGKESILCLKRQRTEDDESVEIDEELHNEESVEIDHEWDDIEECVEMYQELHSDEESREIDQELHNSEESVEIDQELHNNEESIEIDQELHNNEVSYCEKCENFCKLADYNKKQCNALQSSMKALQNQVEDLKSKISVLEIELSNFKKIDIIPCKIKRKNRRRKVPY